MAVKKSNTKAPGIAAIKSAEKGGILAAATSDQRSALEFRVLDSRKAITSIQELAECLHLGINGEISEQSIGHSIDLLAQSVADELDAIAKALGFGAAKAVHHG